MDFFVAVAVDGAAAMNEKKNEYVKYSRLTTVIIGICTPYYYTLFCWKNEKINFSFQSEIIQIGMQRDIQ